MEMMTTMDAETDLATSFLPATKPIRCRYGCEDILHYPGFVHESTSNIYYLDQENMIDHERYSCPGKIVACVNGCGQRVRSDQMTEHTSPWGGDCLERFVRCPSNFVGWRIRLTGEELLGLLSRSLATKNNSEFAFLSLVASSSSSVSSKMNKKAKKDQMDGNSGVFANSSSSVSFEHLSSSPAFESNSSLGMNSKKNNIATMGNNNNLSSTPTAGIGIVIKYDRKLPENPTNRAETVRVVGSNPHLSVDHVDESDRDFLLVRFGSRHLWLNVWSTPFTLLGKATMEEVHVASMGADGKNKENKGQVGIGQGGPTAVQVGGAKDKAVPLFECGWVIKADLYVHLQTRCCNRAVWLGGDDLIRGNVARQEDDSDDEASSVLSVTSLGHQARHPGSRASRAASQLAVAASLALQAGDSMTSVEMGLGLVGPGEGKSVKRSRWLEDKGSFSSQAHGSSSVASVYSLESTGISTVTMEHKKMLNKLKPPKETAGRYRATDLGESIEVERMTLLAHPSHQSRFKAPTEDDWSHEPKRSRENSMLAHQGGQGDDSAASLSFDHLNHNQDAMSEVSMLDNNFHDQGAYGQGLGPGTTSFHKKGFKGQRAVFKHSLNMARQRVNINYFAAYEQALVLCGMCDDTAEADTLMGGEEDEDSRLKRQRASEALSFFGDRPPSGVRRAKKSSNTTGRLRCVYGCGEQLVSTDMAEHMAYKCGRRPVRCPQCGVGDDGYLWADELDQHLEQTCPHRIVGCPNQCGGDPGDVMAPILITTNVLEAINPDGKGNGSIRAREKKKQQKGQGPVGLAMPAMAIPQHLSHQCPRRIVPCSHAGCDVRFEYHLRMYHENGDCNYKLILCPQDCGESYLKWEIDDHMRFNCPNKTRHYENHAPCPMDCGAYIKNKHMLEHLTYFCPRRLTECPDRCGVSVRAHKMKYHMLYCPNRQMCCDHEIKSCSKPMKMWFYREFLSRGKAPGGGSRGGGDSGGDDSQRDSDDEDEDIERGSLWQLDEEEEEQVDGEERADGISSVASSSDFPLPHVPTPYAQNIRKGLKYVREQRRQVDLESRGKQFLSRFLDPSDVESADTVSTHSSLIELHGEQGPPLTRGQRAMYRKGKGQWRPATAGSRLRMTKCKQHGMTALMAAIRLPLYNLDGTEIKKATSSPLKDKGSGPNARQGQGSPTSQSLALVTFASPSSDVNTTVPGESNAAITTTPNALASRIKGEQNEPPPLSPTEVHNDTAFPEPEDDGQEQVAMVDFILSQTGGCDLDAENNTGDTALIIACRWGKYKLVELLIQRGADVNLETSKGKTALIETVKARVQSMRILLYLLEMGATVGHKSVRCRVTALDWSRNMRRGHFKRALELEQVVQRNVLTLFRCIGCGDYLAIERLLDFTSMIHDNAPTAARRPQAAKEKKSRVGMKFDPLLPAKIQNEMELFLQSAKGCEKEAKQIDRDIDVDLQGAVMEQKKVVAERTDRAVHSARMLDEALRTKKGMDMRMSGAYVLFERNVIKVNIADLEELLRCSEPDYSMRLAMFTFGLMFDVLPRMTWLEAGYPEGRQSTRSGRRSSTLTQLALQTTESSSNSSSLANGAASAGSSTGPGGNAHAGLGHNKSTGPAATSLYNLTSVVSERMSEWWPQVRELLTDTRLTLTRIKNFPLDRVLTAFMRRHEFMGPAFVQSVNDEGEIVTTETETLQVRQELHIGLHWLRDELARTLIAVYNETQIDPRFDPRVRRARPVDDSDAVPDMLALLTAVSSSDPKVQAEGRRRASSLGLDKELQRLEAMQLGSSQPKNEEEQDSDDDDDENDEFHDDVTPVHDPYSTKHPGRRISLGLRKLSAVEVATSAASRRRSSASSARMAEMQDRRMSSTQLKYVRIADDDLQKMGLGRLTPRQGQATTAQKGTIQTGPNGDGASAEDDALDDESDDEDAMTELNTLHYAAVGGGPVVDDYANDVYNQRDMGKGKTSGQLQARSTKATKGSTNRGKGGGSSAFDLSLAVEAGQRDHSYDTDLGGVLAMHEATEDALQVKPLQREDWAEDSDLDDLSHVGDDSSQELVLEDWEWDSDADENNDGDWVKGQWVPKTRKRPKWWKRIIKHKAMVREKARKAEEEKAAAELRAEHRRERKRVRAMEKQKQLLLLTQQRLEEDEEDDDDRKVKAILAESANKGGGPTQPVPGAGTGSRPLSAKARKEAVMDKAIVPPISGPDNSNGEINQVVYAMYMLLEAATALAVERVASLPVKQRVAETSMANDAKQRSRINAEKRLDFLITERKKTESKLGDKLSEMRSYLTRAQAMREKLRVIKLLNVVTDSGHTALSWAAAYGQYDTVDLMLRTGASPGFTISMVQATATYLQMSYRMYRMRCAMSGQNKELNSGQLAEDALALRQAQRDKGIEQMVLLRRRREDYLNAILMQRRKLRYPVPEAAYAGKWEIIKRIYDKDLLHYNFLGTWSFPSPPLPFKRHRNRHAHNGRKVSLDDIIAHGLSDMAAGEYWAKIGWVPPGDRHCAHGETQIKVAEIMTKVEGRRRRFIEIRDTARKKREELDRREESKAEFEEAVLAYNWPHVMHLAQTTAVSIDHEFGEDGMTALIRSCEEDIEGVDYVYRRNEDGKLCMGVEYLLDRGDYRPAIDIQNKHGQTALIRACILNRQYAVKALLARNANVTFRNNLGKTALHYAVMVGSSECTLMLLENRADPLVEDNEGISCYAAAEVNEYEHILKIMGSYRNGFRGTVKTDRGEDVPVHFMSCPYGCGAAIPPMEFKDHANVCGYRIVECPQGCDDKKIFLTQVEHHTQYLCSHRAVQCTKCKETYFLHLRDKHDYDDCKYRLVLCPYKCSEMVRFFDVEKHYKYTCSMRLVPCSQSCMMFVKACEEEVHCKEHCLNRRVPCMNGCGKSVVFKIMRNHMWDVCSLRKVPCEFCSELVPFPETRAHLKVCPMRYILCPSKCGEMVLIPKIPLHQLTTCPHRVVSCPLMCGANVRIKDRKAHVQTVCGLRIVKCPYLCLIRENPAGNAGVSNDNVNIVTVPGNGASLSDAQALLASGATMTMFPSITMVPNEDEYTRKKRIAQGMLSRPITRQCSVSQTQKLNLGNNNSSSSSTSENQDLPGGGEMGSRLGSEMDEQEETPEMAAERELQVMLAEQLRAEEEEGLEDARDARVWDRVFRFRAGFFDVHTKHECPNRPVACGLCGDKIMAKHRPHHKAELCLRRDVMCRLGGCAKVLPYSDLEEHERIKCRFRQIPCVNGCGVSVSLIRMNQHTNKDCSERFLACPLKCGDTYRYTQMAIHVAKDCPRRVMGEKKVTKYID